METRPIMILGSPGIGKSALLRHITQELLLRNISPVVLIDPVSFLTAELKEVHSWLSSVNPPKHQSFAETKPVDIFGKKDDPNSIVQNFEHHKSKILDYYPYCGFPPVHFLVLVFYRNVLGFTSTTIDEVKEIISSIKRLLAFLKKIIQRFLLIASLIRDKTSRSPTPFKKEPPIGGVKVGGKQHLNQRHVARTLYLEQPLSALT